MIYDKEEIGKRIARQRKKMGYSQEELAFMGGLSKNQISSIECGKSTPKHLSFSAFVIILVVPLIHI